MEFVIVTGMSGAGKSHASKALEDQGFFCIDNLPPTLIPTVAELCGQSEKRIERVALVVDVREGTFLSQLGGALEHLKTQGHRVRVLFLDARDDHLLRRFSETRRPHPLSPAGAVATGIALERERLAELKEQADLVLDTSETNVHELRRILKAAFCEGTVAMAVTLVSFGYRYGIPADADMLFDLRCLPNPHFWVDLQPLPGTDPRILAFLLERPEAKRFLNRLVDFLQFVLPYYLGEGKSYLTIALGCTGGRHRSVAAAEHLAEVLRALGHSIAIRHRDLGGE
ncbi:MAG: RNase adapter RapZ [Candidatus Methylomirabilales bacterium]